MKTKIKKNSKHQKIYFLISFFVFFLIQSCDAPRRSRVNNQYRPYQYENNFENSSSSSAGEGFVSGGDNPAQTTSLEPGFESCDLSTKYFTVDVGYFGLCQSTVDETSFKFMPTVTSTSGRICLVPTYKDASGASTYLGNPQCTFTTAKKEVMGRLFKDRPGYSNYSINGVLVMRDSLVPEYINCMHAYQNWPTNACPYGPVTDPCKVWLSYCPNGVRTNASCDAEGKKYMNYVCTNFKTRYQSAYADLRVR